MAEEPRRAFGLVAPEEEPVKRPVWATPALWALCGALIGAGFFVWSQRRGLERAARSGLPQAKVAARGWAKAAQDAAHSAQDFAKAVSAPEPPADDMPRGPSMDTLAPPVDPSRPRAKAAGSRRSLGGRRRTGEKEFAPAGDVQDVRARWDAPDVSYEAPVPWKETDMGKGVMLTGGLAVFFWLLGWALFRFTSKRAKTF
ncbi:MAG: hypothetical protein HY928_10895 [Elusimicrobia bacterium]|nr:hypothetical protein [Elusimicrobiota bacterium]